jgi:hypothetical protein
MNSHIEKSEILVAITWDKEPKMREVRLGGLSAALDARAIGPRAMECRSLDACEALVIFSPFAQEDMDVVEINGIHAQIASRPTGGFGFVPSVDTPGVEILAHGSASWLPGGPIVMDQAEAIYRFEDLYWTEAQGDVENQRVVVGQFGTLEDGVRAAAHASVYFTVDDAGKLICDLDDWPQDE